MTWALRYNTASQEVPLGPFVDSTDGNTAETGLTIANTDIKLQKSGGTTQVDKNSGGATHIATGDYYAVLDATDTDTVGPMRVKVHVSGALPVWLDCCVYPQQVYDSLFVGSDILDVSTTQFNGSAVVQSGGRPEVNTTHVGGTSQTAGDIVGDTNDIQARLPAALVGGRMDSSVGAMAANTLNASALATDAVDEIVDATWDEAIAGHLTAGSTGNALNAAGSAGDPWSTPLPGAYGAGTAGKIIGDNINATISSRSTLDAAGIRTAVGLATANLDTQIAALPTAAENADAIWDEARSGHTTAGSFGQGVASVQGNVTGSVGSVTGAVGSVTGAVGSVTGNVGGNVTGSVGSVAANGITASSLAADAGAELADAVWDELLAGHAGAGSSGAALTTASGGSDPAVIAAAVWDEQIAGHIAAGTTANALNNAGAGGNPWDAVLEGTLTAGDLQRITAGVAAGKSSIVTGTGTADVTFRDVSDTGDIVVAHVVGSERTTVTVSP